ncbi:MAG: NFYB/HAP3 family transcription factor subunit, partial [Methanothrix sp.]|nr:NFYB/HAP3 family transcription factor subunit [Methanothrix sp.]
MPILPVAPVSRLIREAGAKRVSEGARDALAEVLEGYGLEVAREAVGWANHQSKELNHLRSLKGRSMAKEDISGLDYRALGLICGIEIHQQLDTACKLFCGCPTKHREAEESNFEFFRYLRPSRSELGEIDRAALEEVLVSRKFLYKSYDSTCLVEADEEPPREINGEALQISLVIARLLNMKIVDELEIMRKMVIDGSNTSGFQR